MAVLRLFAQAREAAGTGRDVVDADTVGGVLRVASQRYGAEFDTLLAVCGVWLNGHPVELGAAVTADDEVAVLPPVSGGAR